MVDVNPASDRLQLLSPFDRWDHKDLENMQVGQIAATGYRFIFSTRNVFVRC